MKTFRIYLIRHGITEANEKGLYVGQTDLPLSPAGLKDLLDLKEEYIYPEATKFYCAPLMRCRQTLEVLYPKCEPEEVFGLNECDFGKWDGKSFFELKDDPEFQDWTMGKSGDIPDGEMPGEFQLRVMTAFEQTVQEILKSGETDTVMCLPGGVLMLIMTAYGLPQLEMNEWATEPGTGYCLRITPELWMKEPVAEALCMIPWDESDENNDDEDDFCN